MTRNGSSSSTIAVSSVAEGDTVLHDDVFAFSAATYAPPLSSDTSPAAVAALAALPAASRKIRRRSGGKTYHQPSDLFDACRERRSLVAAAELVVLETLYRSEIEAMGALEHPTMAGRIARLVDDEVRHRTVVLWKEARYRLQVQQEVEDVRAAMAARQQQTWWGKVGLCQ